MKIKKGPGPVRRTRKRLLASGRRKIAKEPPRRRGKEGLQSTAYLSLAEGQD